MSQDVESTVKKCEVVVDATNDVQNNQNNSTNTLKSVRKKFRNFTLRRRKAENLKSDSIDDQNEMNQDKNSDESFDKSKITLKKIFRKSSFKKFITNIQHFTNFTVSGLQLIQEKRKTELSIVRKKKLDSLE